MLIILYIRDDCYINKDIKPNQTSPHLKTSQLIRAYDVEHPSCQASLPLLVVPPRTKPASTAARSHLLVSCRPPLQLDVPLRAEPRRGTKAAEHFLAHVALPMGDTRGDATTDFLLPSSFSASPLPERVPTKPRGRKDDDGRALPSVRSDNPGSWPGCGVGNLRHSGWIRRDNGWRQGKVVAALSSDGWWRRSLLTAETPAQIHGLSDRDGGDGDCWRARPGAGTKAERRGGGRRRQLHDAGRPPQRGRRVGRRRWAWATVGRPSPGSRRKRWLKAVVVSPTTAVVRRWVARRGGLLDGHGRLIGRGGGAWQTAAFGWCGSGGGVLGGQHVICHRPGIKWYQLYDVGEAWSGTFPFTHMYHQIPTCIAAPFT